MKLTIVLGITDNQIVYTCLPLNLKRWHRTIFDDLFPINNAIWNVLLYEGIYF